MALDAVAEEVLEEFDAFARLTQVKCDDGVRRKVQAVGNACATRPCSTGTTSRCSSLCGRF